MTRMRAVFMGFVAMSGLVVAQAAPVSVTLTWLGQATFVMSTSAGAKLLIDPTNPGAYKPAPVDGVDAVTISHEHGDHNYVQMATGSPLLIRGLTPDGFAKVDQTVKGVRIRTVAAYHDPQQGGQRGRNALFVFELPGLRVVHLGDLGHRLDPQQVSAIGPVDILMTPMAGGPTMDANTALEVIDQLNAKVVIPMHYATAAMAARRGPAAPAGAAPPPAGARGGFSMAGIDEFLKALPPSVKVEQAGHQVTFDAGRLPAQRTVFVMKYE
jgi:L-ascorbate metabolism protein UlaG (beta-lactamase superfamily)